jgi:DNA repair ATPase RecN
MNSGYAYWAVTGAVGLMVGSLAWFIKRLVTELETKIARGEKSACDRMDALEKRMDKHEERYDRLLTQLPEKYALRDDLIRMSQNIESQLGQIRELILSALREREDRR